MSKDTSDQEKSLEKFKYKIKKFKSQNINKKKKEFKLISKYDVKNQIKINDKKCYIIIGFIGKKKSGKSLYFKLISEKFKIKDFTWNEFFMNGLNEEKNILLYDPIQYNDNIKDFIIKNCSILIYISKDDDYDISEIEEISSQIKKLNNRTQFLVIHNLECIYNEFNYLEAVGTLSKICQAFSFNSTKYDYVTTYCSKYDKDLSFHLFFIGYYEGQKSEQNDDSLNYINDFILNNCFYRDYNEYKYDTINLDIDFERENKQLKIKFSDKIENLKVKTKFNKEKIEFIFSGKVNGKELNKDNIIKKSILYMDYPIKNFEPKLNIDTGKTILEYELLM